MAPLEIDVDRTDIAKHLSCRAGSLGGAQGRHA
jgi:hypothetical protein